MRFLWNAAAVALFAHISTANIVMHFDKALEGQVDKVEIITQAPGKVKVPASFMSKEELGDSLSKGKAAKVKLTPKAALDLLLKRQYYCDPGYGYCSGKLQLIGWSSETKLTEDRPRRVLSRTRPMLSIRILSSSR